MGRLLPHDLAVELEAGQAGSVAVDDDVRPPGSTRYDIAVDHHAAFIGMVYRLGWRVSRDLRSVALMVRR